jgi:threonine dehydrogenase-like Zn-dependent dehydrogenase
MLAGHASFYFSPVVSMPFVPGHEIVGTLLDANAGISEGTRVVIEPVLACAARGIDPPCEACARGDIGLCTRTAMGHIAPGMQTGFCEDTGGGWGTQLIVHSSQVHAVPDAISDETAVLIEPLACAVHATLRANVGAGDTVLVAGAGTMGLLTIAALRQLADPARVIAVAKHDRQRVEATRLGADDIARPDSVARTVRLATRALLHEPEQGDPWLAGGVDVSFECSGNAGSLDTCLRVTRAQGRVVLVGLPAPSRIDLAPVWHRELQLMGAYTYGLEDRSGARVRTFDIAIDIAKRVDLSSLVSAAYPLTRYAEAIDHAMDAGRLGSVKVVFDLGQK